MNTRLAWFCGLSVGALAVGCSSGGGGPAVANGVFLDSTVEGLGFQSGGLSGLTDAGGTFQAEGGSPILFSIGDIQLGQVGFQAIVTPVDLVPGATDQLDAAVTNIARLLQTLDTNEDPDDGITIDAVVSAAAQGQALDFNASIVAFEAAAQPVVDVLSAGLPGGARTLIAAALAQQHLAATLLGSLAGHYQGTFAGDDSGSFSVFIDRSGTLFGYAVTSLPEVLGLSGNSSTNGGFLAGVVTSSATFSGSIDGNGVLAGTWQLAPEGGTFMGSRVTSVDPQIDLDLIAMRAGTYTGTYVSTFETGAVTIVLDAAGNLSAPPPDDQLAMTVVSTTGNVIAFAGLTIEGCDLTGSIDGAGAMSGSFQNPLDGESGTFTASLVP